MRSLFALAMLTAAFAATPADAQDSLAPGLRQCAAIADPAGRLGCYDRLAGMSASPARKAPERAVNPVADFGTDTIPDTQPLPRPRSPLNSITSEVADFRFDPRGHFIVSLANGQIWREIEGDTPLVPLRKDRTHTATISRAVLGSYSIRFDNPRGLFKVVRVR